MINKPPVCDGWFDLCLLLLGWFKAQLIKINKAEQHKRPLPPRSHSRNRLESQIRVYYSLLCVVSLRKKATPWLFYLLTSVCNISSIIVPKVTRSRCVTAPNLGLLHLPLAAQTCGCPHLEWYRPLVQNSINQNK